MRRAIRWDRLGRVALLGLLGLVLLLYIGPARSYVSTWQQAKHKGAEVARLQAEHERLLAERNALRHHAHDQREARRLGMVRPGERAYVIRGTGH